MIETAIERLASPETWTKGALARTGKGNVIGPECANAACFCVMGALIRTDPNFPEQILDLLHTAACELFPERVGEGRIAMFNDHPDTTHADVLRVLRRARELELAAE